MGFAPLLHTVIANADAAVLQVTLAVVFADQGILLEGIGLSRHMAI